MATLMIRDLDDHVKARLRVQAAEHGRSMEAEARDLLAQALQPRRPLRGLGTHIHEQFLRVGGADLDFPRRDEPAPVADLGA